MDELRLNLLIGGAIIVIAIIIFDRRRKASDGRSISFDHSQPWHSEQDDSISENQPDLVTSDGDYPATRFTNPFAKKGRDIHRDKGQIFNFDEQDQLSQNQRHPLTNTKNTPFKKYVESMLAVPSNINLYTADRSSLDIEPLVIVLNVMSHDGGYFDGQHVKSALETLGLSFGENNIFHFFNERVVAGDLSGQTRKQVKVFSVLKAIEPGYFDYKSINSFSTPGLALFMQLPGPMDGLSAFKILQSATVLLAEGLDGIICDSNRTKMTPQLIAHLRDQISEYTIKMLSLDPVKLT